MRAIDIVATDNDDRDLETLLIRVDKHLGSSFACSIWISGGKNACLQEIVIIIFDLSVDLVGRYMDEFLDTHFLGTLKQNVGSVHVSVGETI